MTDWSEVAQEVGKWIGGGLGGAFLGFSAKKSAAKSEAVKELQVLKNEYKEFAEFTKTELELSKLERRDCHAENRVLSDMVHELKVKVNELTMAMHNMIGTPQDKRK